MAGDATGLSSIFSKTDKAASEAGNNPAVPSVPVGRVTASPRRLIGRGTRDTILNGANGL